MPIDELVLSENDVHSFFARWVPAMRTAQNSADIPGDETEAVEIIEDSIPGSPPLTVKKYDISPDQNRPNLFVTYTPEGADPDKKPILFAGVHTDCVPIDHENQLTYHTDGEKAYGRGTLDNGSNVMACLGVIDYLVEHNPKLDRPIVFAFTADEEASATRFGFDGLIEAGIVDPEEYAAAVFADTPWSAWSTKGVGLYDLTVNIDGKGGHSGMTPSAYTIAFELFGKLQDKLAAYFPDKGPYTVGTIMQANVVTPGKEDGPTTTAPQVTIKGDIRSNPRYELTDVVDALKATAAAYVAGLEKNPQTSGYADMIHVDFNAHAHEDGYVMPQDFMPVAARVIQAGYEAAGIEGQEPTLATGGGLPGLRGFVEKGLLTIATGAGGNPGISSGYHGPEEHVIIDEVAKGPAYLFGVAQQLDAELTEMGK